MSIEAMKLALEALESKYIVNCGAWRVQQDQAAKALRAAIETTEALPKGYRPIEEIIAEHEQDPVKKAALDRARARIAKKQEPWGYISHKSWKMPVFVEADNLEVSGLPFNNPNYTPVYKTPPQREWVGLTNNEISDLWNAPGDSGTEFARAIEAKLKEKNYD